MADGLVFAGIFYCGIKIFIQERIYSATMIAVFGAVCLKKYV